MTSQLTFCWNKNKKSQYAKLSNNNLTCSKNTKPGDENDEFDIFAGFIGNLGMMNTGKYYWELKIDNVDEYEEMFVGVCREDFDLTRCPGTTEPNEQEFWGYATMAGEKFTPDEKNVEYGDVIQPGDNLGVLLEFRKGIGSLKFYLNGMNMEECCTNMKGEFYPIVSFFGNTTQVTLDPRAPMPLN